MRREFRSAGCYRRERFGFPLRYSSTIPVLASAVCRVRPSSWRGLCVCPSRRPLLCSPRRAYRTDVRWRSQNYEREFFGNV